MIEGVDPHPEPSPSSPSTPPLPAQPTDGELLAAHVEEAELRRVFNLGVGFVFVVAPEHEALANETLTKLGEAPIPLGEIVSVPEGTDFEARVVFP